MPKPRSKVKSKVKSAGKGGVVPTEQNPMVTCNELMYIWQKLWNLRLGAPSPTITRLELQQEYSNMVYPELTTFGCLITFRDDGLIRCIKDGKEIPFSLNESDYEQFSLTSKGTRLGDLYKC